jgi:hypothetical protein
MLKGDQIEVLSHVTSTKNRLGSFAINLLQRMDIYIILIHGCIVICFIFSKSMYT